MYVSGYGAEPHPPPDACATGEFSIRAPERLDEALELLAQAKGSGRVIAGGQSLGPMLNLCLAFPETVFDICRLPGLMTVEERDGVLSVGAAVRHADFEDGKVPDIANGLLTRTASSIAYRAVRSSVRSALVLPELKVEIEAQAVLE